MSHRSSNLPRAIFQIPGNWEEAGKKFFRQSDIVSKAWVRCLLDPARPKTQVKTQVAGPTIIKICMRISDARRHNKKKTGGEGARPPRAPRVRRSLLLERDQASKENKTVLNLQSKIRPRIKSVKRIQSITIY